SKSSLHPEQQRDQIRSPVLRVLCPGRSDFSASFLPRSSSIRRRSSSFFFLGSKPFILTTRLAKKIRATSTIQADLSSPTWSFLHCFCTVIFESQQAKTFSLVFLSSF